MLEIISPTYKTLENAVAAVMTGKNPVVVGAIPLIPLNDSASSELNAYCYEGQLRGPLKTGDTPALGATAYWDDTLKEFTVTLTANIKIGRFLDTGPDANSDIAVDFDAFNLPA